MDFNIKIPVNVISGKGCLLNNSAILRKYGKKCVIVTGGKSAHLSGALGDMEEVLKKENIKYVLYDKIGPNPKIDHCHEAGKIARDFGADFIVGIGGGSPLDAAKAVAVYTANPDFAMEDIFNYGENERNRALPLVLVGTTSGTGSEVGRVSVLTNPVTGRKRSIAPDDTYPALSFADSTYTESMPYDVTVSTALDALAHAIEGYMSVKCGDIPTMFGEKAIALIWEGLKYLHETKALPDSSLREKLYYGSLYAGITLSYCGTAFPHPLGYILTENFGIPHGKACTTFMGDFIDRAAEHCSEKTQRIMKVMGTDIDTFKAIIDELTNVHLTMTKEEIEGFCERYNTVPANFTFSPGGFTKEDAIKAFCDKFCK
ncbi:MAG: iron-containing alcohol dehydrogenase [Clostridia bacterium]|nr:iron-containing alcohol dehydrogenase [Clostridia bacterium]